MNIAAARCVRCGERTVTWVDAHGLDLTNHRDAAGTLFHGTPLRQQCRACGCQHALGPARDVGKYAAQVTVEVRAAEIATRAIETDGLVSHFITASEWSGWLDSKCDSTPVMAAEWAGWLAREIWKREGDA